MAETIKIGGELESKATGGIVARAHRIYDEDKEKYQSQVNAETDAALDDRYTKAQTYSKTELNNMITTPNQEYISVTATDQTTAVTDVLPATGAANTIYRVGNWDGSQFDASVYSEYSWNGSQYVHLSTKTQIGEVFDISAYHATGGELATYADLSAALDSNNGGGVPQSLQKGGMSVKFVQSSDNKYVQYRLIADAWSTVVTDWSFCGDDVLVENPEWIYILLDSQKRILAGLKSDGSVEWSIGVPTPVKTYIDNAIAEIKNGTEGTDLDGINKIIAFLSDFSTSDTLKDLLDTKVDKEEGKSLIDSEFAASQSVVDNPEYIRVEVDSEGKILCGRKVDGTKVENMPVETPTAFIESVDSPEWIKVDIDKNGKVLGGYKPNGKFYAPGGIEGIDFSGIQNQINNLDDAIDTLDERVDSLEDKVNIEIDEIPYNDLLSIGSKILKVYNPYKESKQHQYIGQMHCHSWTKFVDAEYPQDFPGEKWKVPYGYSISAIPTGETNTEKYLWDMPHEKVVAILNALAMAFVWRHKKLGYDFMTISNYAQFGDVTHKPNLSDITYLQTQYPDAYAYFASLYLDGFDVNDFDANGNLKDFQWLCDSYESITTTLGANQHIVVHCAPNFSVPYRIGTFNDVMNRVEDYGCISQWAHPTDVSTYATSEILSTVKKRLRLMEVYDGISTRKYDANGVMTNTNNSIQPGVMLDGPIDELLTQGNFVFCMAISDERPTYRRSGTGMFQINPPKNLKNGCVKVFCDELTSENIFESLLSGNFYASTDSDISINSVSIENGKYTVDIGMEGVTIEFLKENNTILDTVITSAGNTIASYNIIGNEKFVRARLYVLNDIPYDSDYWYKNKEWIIWTQPILISNKIL